MRIIITVNVRIENDPIPVSVPTPKKGKTLVNLCRWLMKRNGILTDKTRAVFYNEHKCCSYEEIIRLCRATTGAFLWEPRRSW